MRERLVVESYYPGGATLREVEVTHPIGSGRGRRVTTTIQVYGRIGRAPEQRTTAAGKAMVTGAMVVDLGRDVEAPEWFSLVAFGTISEVLANHQKGDMVAVSGRLTKSLWTGRDGAESARASRCSSMPSRALARCGRGRLRFKHAMNSRLMIN